MTRFVVLLLGVAAAGTAFGAQPIGRLFFTPAERDQLDIARTQKRLPETPAAAAPEERVSTRTVTYSGIVRRSDGKATVWLNHRPADGKTALSDLELTGRIKPNGAVTLRVPETGASIDLRVGQRAELQTGRVSESRPGTPDQAAAKGDATAKADAPAKSDASGKAENPGKPEPVPAKQPEKDATPRKSEAASAPPSTDGTSHRDLQQRAAGAR